MLPTRTIIHPIDQQHIVETGRRSLPHRTLEKRILGVDRRLGRINGEGEFRIVHDAPIVVVNLPVRGSRLRKLGEVGVPRIDVGIVQGDIIIAIVSGLLMEDP